MTMQPLMRMRSYGATFSILMTTILISVVANNTALSATAEMGTRLWQVIQEETQSMITTNSLTRIEDRYLHEYHSTKSQDDKLLICQEMVRLYVNDGMRNTAKIEEYVLKGLKHATSPVDRSDLFVALGDAKIATSRRDQTLAISRAKCVRPYIEAWCELHQYGHIGKLEELPCIDLFDGPGNTNDPIFQAMAQEHTEQVLARKNIEQRNRVLRLRSRALGQIRILYSAAKEEELRRDVKSVVADDGIVREILAGVASES